MRRFAVLTLALGACALFAPSSTMAQPPYIGQIIWLAGEQCPQGWAQANGQILTIDANTPLFSEIGTAYGGDGASTFALPDLRGRAPVHFGRAPDLSEVARGARLGAERVTLAPEQLPPHAHAIPAIRPDGGAQEETPQAGARGLFRKPGASTLPSIGINLVAAAGDGARVSARTQSFGEAAVIENRSPSLALTACIALDGRIPARN